MKKFIAMLLALTVVCSFAACGNTNNEPEVKLPGSALEILETVWASYPEEEKSYCGGGGYQNMTENAPATILAEDTDALLSQLHVAEDQVANVTEAASLMHGMIANNFTAGAFKVNDAAAFATAMRESVVVFGNGEIVANFQAKLVAAYPDAVVAVNEPIV